MVLLESVQVTVWFCLSQLRLRHGFAESALNYGMARQDNLAGTLIADMHGDGVKSWNCVVIVPVGTFVICIVPGLLRHALALRALVLVANALPSSPGSRHHSNSSTSNNIKTK